MPAVIDPLPLLAVHACRTGQFDKIRQWLSSGCGHTFDANLERWFDRAKLEAYYQKQRSWLDERGYVVGDGWYAEGNWTPAALPCPPAL
jgi:hypothetical protein